MNLDITLLIGMMISALWTVMCRDLLRAALGLAVTSAFLTLLMYRLGAPLAAVFELSVCAGLITVLFISTISLTKPQTYQEVLDYTKERIRRFWFLPILLAVLGGVMALYMIPVDFRFFSEPSPIDVRTMLWHYRQIDLFAQIAIVVAGVFGVVVLYKRGFKHGR